MRRMKIVIITGPPGAGKGTQAEILEEKHDWRWFSLGQLFRDAHDPELDAILLKGDLVSNEVATDLVVKEIKSTDQTILIDGYPRNLEQVTLFEEALQELGATIVQVLFLQLSREESLQRILKRGRRDDTEEVFAHRWSIYEQETVPVIQHYQQRGIVAVIEGLGEVEDIAACIDEAVA